MINELPRRGPVPHFLTRLGLILLGFVIAGLLVAVVVLAIWIFGT